MLQEKRERRKAFPAGSRADDRKPRRGEKETLGGSERLHRNRHIVESPFPSRPLTPSRKDGRPAASFADRRTAGRSDEGRAARHNTQLACRSLRTTTPSRSCMRPIGRALDGTLHPATGTTPLASRHQAAISSHGQTTRNKRKAQKKATRLGHASSEILGQVRWPVKTLLAKLGGQEARLRGQLHEDDRDSCRFVHVVLPQVMTVREDEARDLLSRNACHETWQQLSPLQMRPHSERSTAPT
jgi:hypothetical protein